MGLVSRIGGALLTTAGAFLAGASAPLTAGAAVIGYAMVGADEDEKRAASYRDGKEAGYKNGEMKAKTELNKRKINGQ